MPNADRCLITVYCVTATLRFPFYCQVVFVSCVITAVDILRQTAATHGVLELTIASVAKV